MSSSAAESSSAEGKDIDDDDPPPETDLTPPWRRMDPALNPVVETNVPPETYIPPDPETPPLPNPDATILDEYAAGPYRGDDDAIGLKTKSKSPKTTTK